MKKALLISLLAVLLIGLGTSDVFAQKRRRSHNDNFLNLTFLVNPAGLGYMHHLGKNVYATGTLDYNHSESDLAFRLGGAYLFPIKVLIFRFYGGGGFQLSRNEGYQYPYVHIGTKFLFLYTEIIYPMEKRLTPEYRLGFSFRF